MEGVTQNMRHPNSEREGGGEEEGSQNFAKKRRETSSFRNQLIARIHPRSLLFFGRPSFSQKKFEKRSPFLCVGVWEVGS